MVVVFDVWLTDSEPAYLVATLLGDNIVTFKARPSGNRPLSPFDCNVMMPVFVSMRVGNEVIVFSIEFFTPVFGFRYSPVTV